MKNIFYFVILQEKKTILVAKTLPTYIVYFLGIVGLISCVNNNLYVSIPIFVIVITLMSIKYITYWNLFKEYKFDKKKYTISGSKYSFQTPLSYEIYSDK